MKKQFFRKKSFKPFEVGTSFDGIVWLNQMKGLCARVVRFPSHFRTRRNRKQPWREIRELACRFPNCAEEPYKPMGPDHRKLPFFLEILFCEIARINFPRQLALARISADFALQSVVRTLAMDSAITCLLLFSFCTESQSLRRTNAPINPASTIIVKHTDHPIMPGLSSPRVFDSLI